MKLCTQCRRRRLMSDFLVAATSSLHIN